MNQEIQEMIKFWIILISILLGASLLGLVLSLIKAVLLAFGIETNL